MLTGAVPNLTYKPNDDFNGNDSFTFKANDGTTDTKETTIKVTITPVNDIPKVKGQELTFDQGESQEITFLAEDIDSEAFTYSIVTPPTKGKLSEIKESKVTYIPNEGYQT